MARPYTFERSMQTWLVLILTILSATCKPNHSVTLEPTIEEPSRPSAVINMGDLATGPQLIRGFYPIEENSWRWTTGHFEVLLGAPPAASRVGGLVVLKINVPELLVQRYKAVTLSCELNHALLASETYSRAEAYEYRRDVPAAVFETDPLQLRCSLNKYFAAGAIESRELGLVVTSIALEPK